MTTASDMPGKNPLAEDFGVLKSPCASTQTTPQCPGIQAGDDPDRRIARSGQHDRELPGSDRRLHRRLQRLVDRRRRGRHVIARRGPGVNTVEAGQDTLAGQQPLGARLRVAGGACETGWAASPAMNGT